MRAAGPTSEIVGQLARDRGRSLGLLAVEVAVLDLLGRRLKAVAAREVVLEGQKGLLAASLRKRCRVWA
jgi:hypothetical protein